MRRRHRSPTSGALAPSRGIEPRSLRYEGRLPPTARGPIFFSWRAVEVSNPARASLEPAPVPGRRPENKKSRNPFRRIPAQNRLVETSTRSWAGILPRLVGIFDVQHGDAARHPRARRTHVSRRHVQWKVPFGSCMRSSVADSGLLSHLRRPSRGWTPKHSNRFTTARVFFLRPSKNRRSLGAPARKVLFFPGSQRPGLRAPIWLRAGLTLLSLSSLVKKQLTLT